MTVDFDSIRKQLNMLEKAQISAQRDPNQDRARFKQAAVFMTLANDYEKSYKSLRDCGQQLMDSAIAASITSK